MAGKHSYQAREQPHGIAGYGRAGAMAAMELHLLGSGESPLWGLFGLPSVRQRLPLGEAKMPVRLQSGTAALHFAASLPFSAQM
jgi:hypothetical protein